MRCRVLVAAALAASCHGGIATAQQRNDDVIVEGRRESSPEADRRVLRAIVPRVPANKQLPRFMGPVCISVGGLKTPIARQIADRMATNAGDAGIEVQPAGCKPNILVMFVTDGRVEARNVVARNGWLFGAASPTLSQFVDVDGPARIFNLMSTLSRDGDRVYTPGTQVTAEGAQLAGYDNVLKQPDASRIGPATRTTIGAVLLVIDRPALIDRTVVQIADYATMRVLADARFGNGAGSGTILSLFEGNVAAPPAMTRIDRSLLTELYRDSTLQNPNAEINAAVRAAER